MKRVVGAFNVLLVASIIGLARNAADLKSDLKGMLPAGVTKVRLAWIRGGDFTEFPFYAKNTVVYVVDSDDGVIRQLYPATGSGIYHTVNITADGSRVTFYNGNTGRLCVVNWDGSGFKEVNVGGMPMEYWRNPADGSDWSVVGINDAMFRVKIDQPATKVAISAPGEAVASNGGTGLSDDGTKCVGYLYNHNPAGFSVTNINGASLTWSFGVHGGCWCSMSAGKPYYNHNPSGHKAMCVHDAANQASFTSYEVGAALEAYTKSRNLQQTWTDGDFTTEGTRFTQHPEYATTCFQQSKVNPFLFHLPDLRCVYIEDGLPKTFCGDMDAVFLPTTGIAGKAPGASEVALHRSSLSQETYLPDGRRLSPALPRAHGPAARGVVIRYVKDRGAAAFTVGAAQRSAGDSH